MNMNISNFKNYVTTLPKWAIGIAVGLALGLTVVVLDRKGVFKEVTDSWRVNSALKAGPLSGMNPDKITAVRIIKLIPGGRAQAQMITDAGQVKDLVSALAHTKPAGIVAGTQTPYQLVLLDAEGNTKSVRVNEFVIRQNAPTSSLAAQWDTPESLRKLLR
jgi:hypothetical protein